MSNRAVFAGIADAVAFDYGGPLPDAPPPLVIISTPTTSPLTNPATFNVETGVLSLTDGTSLAPLASTCPILVGDGPGQEKITPSSVSNPTSTIPGAASFTGTFLITHGNGDTVRSGTHGLQEAINYMIAQGGGKVSVSSQWAAAGGTTTMVNAATFNSPKTVDILDYRS